jgi:cytochrome c-type biogenesis protein CcmE
MKPKHQRLIFIGVSVVFVCVATLLALQAFRNNVIFFYSPSELVDQEIEPAQKIRIGGLVETGSLSHKNELTHFTVTDGKSHIDVTYKGMLPGLFREGQGVVAEGHMRGNAFIAERVLTKHDEYYMPKDVVDALKKSGRWTGH